MATNLVTAKRLQDVKLDGIKVDWEKRDSNVIAITLTDAAGNMVRIARASFYSDALAMFVPEPPKFEDRWILSGTFAGCHVRRTFDAQQAAEETKREFPRDADLTIEKQAVQIDEVGEPVGADAEIPF